MWSGTHPDSLSASDQPAGGAKPPPRRGSRERNSGFDDDGLAVINFFAVKHQHDKQNAHLLLYVDRTVFNEYTSPQMYTGLQDFGIEPFDMLHPSQGIEGFPPSRPMGLLPIVR